jgi:transcriptional regulator of acetoin/glycerol metabolism
MEAKRNAIVAALRETHGNVDGAAYLLDVGRTTVYKKIGEYEIKPHEWMPASYQRAA